MPVVVLSPFERQSYFKFYYFGLCFAVFCKWIRIRIRICRSWVQFRIRQNYANPNRIRIHIHNTEKTFPNSLNPPQRPKATEKWPRSYPASLVERAGEAWLVLWWKLQKACRTGWSGRIWLIASCCQLQLPVYTAFVLKHISSLKSGRVRRVL